MDRFSVRNGHQAARDAVQLDDLDNEVRVAIWNALDEVRDEMFEYWDPDSLDEFGRAFWTQELGQLRDEYDDVSETWDAIRNRVLNGQWWHAMDLLEGLLEPLHESKQESDAYELLVGGGNHAFSTHLVGYRIVGTRVVPIDSEVALDAVDGALGSADQVARHHLERALDLLADRQSPDYANSIKESISAVEAAVRAASNQARFAVGVKKLKSTGVAVHPAIEQTWLAMYGWMSNEPGVRHGGTAAPVADQALAKYMLVTCSAFVSYLLEVGAASPGS